MKILPRSFYTRSTLTVARQLLGKILCRRIGKKILRGRIIEVEAYVGPDDKASHASRGMTKRNAPMFGAPGYAYVYLIYGMYWCLNVVTERHGYPAAVLIRAVAGEKKGVTKTDGPGKLCRAFAITGAQNGIDITKRKNGMWVEDNPRSPPRIRREGIIRAPRIGVDYAGAWKNKKWRFSLKPDC